MVEVKRLFDNMIENRQCYNYICEYYFECKPWTKIIIECIVEEKKKKKEVGKCVHISCKRRILG